ncbi:MAG TPA: DUF2213 domain-containing protein [Spirochaetota bacterium]|nr:DUF2213 domain-containing protein [Spirochaetota bacterium]
MGKKVFRYDRGTIEPFERGDGFLRARVTIARPGVFPYLTPQGTIRMEAKLPDDLFSEITIESAKGKPVLDGHPPISDNNGLINPKNYHKYVKGALGDHVEVKNNHLHANETIFDAALIDDLANGKKVEVSIGFETDMEEAAGEYQGAKYDARQTNIRINHVAHVPQGRAGETVRAHLDAAIESKLDIAVMQTESALEGKKSTNVRGDAMDENAMLAAMKKFFSWIMGGGKDDPAAPAKDGAGAPAKPADDPAKVPEPAKGDSALAEENKKLMARIDALEAVVKKQEAGTREKEATMKMDEAINARMSLVDTARALIKDFKHDGMTNREIKLKVIEQVLPFGKDVKVDSMDDVVIDARYDAALSLAKEKASVMDEDTGAPRFDEKEIATKRAQRLDIQSMK